MLSLQPRLTYRPRFRACAGTRGLTLAAARAATAQLQPEPARIAPAEFAVRIVTASGIPASYRESLQAALTELASPQTSRLGTYPSELTCAKMRITTRLVDLDADSVPEVLLHASTRCDGDEFRISQPRWLLARDPETAGWRVVAQEYAELVPLRSRTEGHVDLVSQPGTATVYWRWDGREYRSVCMNSSFSGNTCVGWRPEKESDTSLPTFGAPHPQSPPVPVAAPSNGRGSAAAVRFARNLVAPLGMDTGVARGLAEVIASVVEPPTRRANGTVPCEDTPLGARLVDLNDDATPEVELRGSPKCPTPNGVSYWLFVRDAETRAWRLALDESGPLRALDTRAGGYRDVVLAPRTSGWTPVWRWIGDAYAPYCNIVPADLTVSHRPCPRSMARASTGTRLPAFRRRP